MASREDDQINYVGKSKHLFLLLKELITCSQHEFMQILTQ